MAVRKFVLLVAGHDIDGDPGSVGQGSTEAKETVQITDKVYNLLASHKNILVERVPHTMDYVDSVNWANKLYKNLTDGIVVEIHKNSFNRSASGNEVLIPAGSDATSKKLANAIQSQLTAQTKLPNRGVKERGDLYLIREINMYACLVEAGFIDKDPISDAFDDKYARGIANGICDFFGESRPGATPAPKPTPAPAPKPTPQPTVSYVKAGTLDGVDYYKKKG